MALFRMEPNLDANKPPDDLRILHAAFYSLRDRVKRLEASTTENHNRQQKEIDDTSATVKEIDNTLYRSHLGADSLVSLINHTKSEVEKLKGVSVMAANGNWLNTLFSPITAFFNAGDKSKRPWIWVLTLAALMLGLGFWFTVREYREEQALIRQNELDLRRLNNGQRMQDRRIQQNSQRIDTLQAQGRQEDTEEVTPPSESER